MQQWMRLLLVETAAAVLQARQPAPSRPLFLYVIALILLATGAVFLLIGLHRWLVVQYNDLWADVLFGGGALVTGLLLWLVLAAVQKHRQRRQRHSLHCVQTVCAAFLEGWHTQER